MYHPGPYRRYRQCHVSSGKRNPHSRPLRSDVVGGLHGSINQNYLMPSAQLPNTPLSPPPPYQAVEHNYPAGPMPAPLYQQPYQSQPHLPSTPLHPLHQHGPQWASTVSLPTQHPQEQPWQTAPALPPRHPIPEPNDSRMARSLNQGAALCDRVASRLNDVLSRLESENARSEEEIEALVRDLTVEDHGQAATADTEQQQVERSRCLKEEPGNGVINFKKTWMYANSRLPPHLLPLKVYIPTWQILCRAADASAAVYQRPRGNESEEYIEADWRQGTKAMVLKSVCLDEKSLIVFAVRGSKWNLVDWAINFRPAPKEPVGFLDDQGNACHAGFLQVARAMIRPVAARLRQLLEQDPGRASSSLVITGHSAGGAVASLLYMHMLSKSTESDLNVLTGCFRRVHCITFGAPPVTLLPLQKPNDDRSKKNVFMAFANEGDPVVRADKQYLYCLARLVAAPAPSVKSIPLPPRGLQSKLSRQKLRKKDAQPSAAAPMWPVPDAALSNAGRLVLLRRKPARKQEIEAVCVSDSQLRDVVFGDPSMHEMALYKRRIDELAVAAVTGRD